MGQLAGPRRRGTVRVGEPVHGWGQDALGSRSAASADGMRWGAINDGGERDVRGRRAWPWMVARRDGKPTAGGRR